ncbi:hypothetical protein [Xanthocytophaga agilis]|uniref:Uncharacterized protein n=1 Tax=Xanthocytophaga agilis TaxID=3048010 RepID=A0AAE3R1R4_9BACT|nr:hypothetical protein [Xanthocytophaga agilis]MDJ1501500.1 hypothetical protein [Xanthocytophaga agilis]
MSKKILFIIGALIIFWGCNSSEETPSPTRLGYDFYPLEVGQYAVYDIFEVKYQIYTKPDTHTYQVKELVYDTITDLTNEPAFILYRYSRANSSSTWELDSAWLTKRTSYVALRKENNVDYVRLSFPLKEGLKWNGNQYNSYGEEMYEASSFDQPYQVLDSTYDKTVTILQRDEVNAVLKDRRMDVYARNTGLIYKERIQLTYLQNGGTVGNGDIDHGTYYIQKIREFGIER